MVSDQTRKDLQFFWLIIPSVAIFLSTALALAPFHRFGQPGIHEYSTVAVIRLYSGILAALLLGECCRKALPTSGRLVWGGCGLLGVGWAAFIINAISGGIPHIYWYCAILQTLWLLRMIAHRPDAVERAFLASRSNKLTACGQLLGRGFVSARRFLAAGAGLLLCVMCVLISWTAIYLSVAIQRLSPQTAEGTVHMIMLLSLLTVLAFVLAAVSGAVIAIFARATDILLTFPAPAGKAWRGVQLPLDVVFFIVLLLATTGVIGPRAATVRTIMVIVVLVWIAIRTGIGRYLARVEAEFRARNIFNNDGRCLDPDTVAAIDLMAAGMPQTVTTDEQGLQITNIGGTRLVPWHDISWLSYTEGRWLGMVDSREQTLVLLSMKHIPPQKRYAAFEEMLDAWGRALDDGTGKVFCEYGGSWQDVDRKEPRQLGLQLLALSLLPFGLVALCLRDADTGPGPIVAYSLGVLFGMAGLAAVWGGIHQLRKRPVPLAGVEIEPEQVTFIWSDGTSTLFKKGQAGICSRSFGYFTFTPLETGRPVNHLERLNNFGLVRKRLLELGADIFELARQASAKESCRE